MLDVSVIPMDRDTILDHHTVVVRDGRSDLLRWSPARIRTAISGQSRAKSG
jgi:hypothetical protein